MSVIPDTGVAGPFSVGLGAGTASTVQEKQMTAIMRARMEGSFWAAEWAAEEGERRIVVQEEGHRERIFLR